MACPVAELILMMLHHHVLKRSACTSSSERPKAIGRCTLDDEALLSIFRFTDARRGNVNMLPGTIVIDGVRWAADDLPPEK